VRSGTPARAALWRNTQARELQSWYDQRVRTRRERSAGAECASALPTGRCGRRRERRACPADRFGVGWLVGLVWGCDGRAPAAPRCRTRAALPTQQRAQQVAPWRPAQAAGAARVSTPRGACGSARCWGCARLAAATPQGAALLRRKENAAAADRRSARRVRVPKATRSGGAKEGGARRAVRCAAKRTAGPHATVPTNHRSRPHVLTLNTPRAAPHRIRGSEHRPRQGRHALAQRGGGSGVRLRRKRGDDVARHAPAVPAPREPAHQPPLPRLHAGKQG